MKRVGVISDTHGLLRPEVAKVFESVDLILHAGDIGKPDVLDDLKRMAPVIAVRGNNDVGTWAKKISDTETVTVGRVKVFMLHDLKEFKRAKGAFQVVI